MRYKKEIKMTDRDVVFKEITLAEEMERIRNKRKVYSDEDSISFDELYSMHTSKPPASTSICVEFLQFGGKTYLMGRFDFARFDGTSCFNFMKALIEFYYSGELPSNRPTLTLDSDIVNNITIFEVIGLAVRCTFGFALCWGSRMWEPDTYALFFPTWFSAASYHTEVLDKEQTTAVIELAKKNNVKPFVKFMWSFFEALARFSNDSFV